MFLESQRQVAVQPLKGPKEWEALLRKKKFSECLGLVVGGTESGRRMTRYVDGLDFTGLSA